MTDQVNAEIIAIGTELLLGELTDTNSVFLAQRLRDLGINLFFMTTVGDNRQRIAEALRIAMGRADVILTCGGLGPTVDDMTRQAVADATERDLVFHQTLLDQIAARFASYRAIMTENNKQQAYLPAEAIVIENPVGTAPAFIVEHAQRTVICLPGVPREMKFLMTEKVIPHLQTKYRLGIIRARILRAAGVGESALDDMLGKALLEQSNPTVGLAAHHGVIDIRMTAKATDVTEAEAMLDGVEALIRERVGHFIFGYGDAELEGVLLDLLTNRGLSIAVVEAGIKGAAIHKLQGAGKTAGLLHSQSWNHPDEAYAITGYRHENTPLRALADSIAADLAAEHNAGIAILCYPDIEENADTEIGTAVAVQVGQSTKSRVYGFGGKNPLARDWVSRWALATAWRMLRDTIPDDQPNEGAEA